MKTEKLDRLINENDVKKHYHLTRRLMPDFEKSASGKITASHYIEIAVVIYGVRWRSNCGLPILPSELRFTVENLIRQLCSSYNQSILPL
jgi:hypothetical protein